MSISSTITDHSILTTIRNSYFRASARIFQRRPQPSSSLALDAPTSAGDGIENSVIDIPLDGSSGTDYAAVDASYAGIVSDDLDLAYADMNPFTRKAYEFELRNNLATG